MWNSLPQSVVCAPSLSVLINSLSIISFCNLLAVVYNKLLGAYLISFANFVPVDLIYNKISPSLLLLLCYILLYDFNYLYLPLPVIELYH